MSNAEDRKMPRYNLPEVAGYVRMSPKTLDYWVRGRGGTPPVIERPVVRDPRLSYENLIEAYVVDVLTKKLRIPLQAVRRGVDHVERSYGIKRFLLSPKLRARKGNLLIEAIEGEGYINVSHGGQLEITEAVEAYLMRVDYESGLPVRLYPVTRTDDPTGPRKIVIFPNIGFGRPVTERNFISTAVISDRFSAGESVSELAEDYDLSVGDIEEALREERIPWAA